MDSKLRFHPATKQEADEFMRGHQRCRQGHEQVRVTFNGTFCVCCDHCAPPDFTKPEAMAVAA